MLTLIALSAALSAPLALQDPPTPPAPPEVRTHVFVRGGDGPGSLDKDGDGHVSREEFAAPMTDHFGRLDKDGDGRLSTEELGAGHGGPGKHEVVVMSGAGGSGAHHFQMRRPHAGGGPEAGEKREVRVMTFGGPMTHGTPGAMSRSQEGGPGHEIEIRHLGGAGQGNDLDADEDGRISEAEFTAPLRDAFARMDKDRSGFVEAAERGADGEVRVFTHRIETRQDGEE